MTTGDLVRAERAHAGRDQAMNTAEAIRSEAIAEARAEITAHLKQAGWSEERIAELFAAEIQVISRPAPVRVQVDRKALTIEGIRLRSDADREYHQRMNQIIEEVQNRNNQKEVQP